MNNLQSFEPDSNGNGNGHPVGNGHHPVNGSGDKSVIVDTAVIVRQELRRIAELKLDSLDLDLELRALAKKTLFGIKVIKDQYTATSLKLAAEQQAVRGNAAGAEQPAALTAEQIAEQQIIQNRQQEIERRAQLISTAPNIFQVFHRDLYSCKGYIASEILTGIILVSHGSRLLSKSTGFLVGGASASGKSDLIQKCADFLPPEIVITCTSFSDQALFYMGDLAHKYFVGGEMRILKPGEDDPFQLGFRQLISENRITRAVVEKIDGVMVNVIKETSGPAAFMLTTTAETNSFNDEFVNRLSIVLTDDSDEMTKLVLHQQAKAAASAPNPLIDQEINLTIEAWRFYHRQLRPVKVHIPFAEMIEPSSSNITMRRLFPLLLDYIRASAILHQASRQLNEETLTITATVEDYKIAYRLIIATAPRVSDLVSKRALTVRDKLKAEFQSEEFTRASAQEKLKISTPALNRFLSTLTRAGCLAMRGEKGKPYIYNVTHVTPEGLDFGLAAPELLTTCSEQVRFGPGDSFTPEKEGCSLAHDIGRGEENIFSTRVEI